MTEYFFLGLAGFGLGLAIFLAAVRLALDELSPGTLRKLELAQPQQAARFAGWYLRRERYRISLHIAQVLAVMLLSFGSVAWALSRRDQAWQLGRQPWLLLLGAAVIYLVSTEILGGGLGKAWGRRLLRLGMPMAEGVALALLPLVWPLEKWRTTLARRRLAAVGDEDETTTADEIMSLVDIDEKNDTSRISLEADERRMIRGIFDLDETLVREIMTPRVDIDAAEEIDSLEEIRQLIVDSGHSRIPVFRDSVDQIVGTVHAKDLLAISGREPPPTVRDLMHPPMFIPEGKNVGDLLGEFQQNSTHFAVVVDEYGGTAGVVTLEDILEEIVGDIRDEYDLDENSASPELTAAGELVVDARTPIYEVNDALGIAIPDDEDVDTVGGYVSSALGRIPKVGELLRTATFEITVLESDERRVLRAKICRLGALAPAPPASEREAC